MSYQRLQTSRAGSSRMSVSSRPTSPKQSAKESFHQSRYLYIDKTNYTEVTVETKDQDIPYISVYKPNFNKQKQRIQATTKIVNIFETACKLKIMYSLEKMLSEKPRQLLMNMKSLYLGATIQKIVLRKRQNTFQSLAVNKIKKNNVIAAANILCRIQNLLLQKNLKSSITELRSHRLRLLVKQLSSENKQALQLQNIRSKLFKINQQAFSKNLVTISQDLQSPNYDSILQKISEHQYNEILKTEIKRFQQIRVSSSPRKKDLLDNQIVLTVTTNIISAFQKTVTDYENYCQELQNELASYKDAKGINELKEQIQEKDKQIKEIQNYITQNNKMDIELKKLITDNRYTIERISSTLMSQSKKLQTRFKTLGQIPSKIASSRIYLSGVMRKLIKEIEGVRNQKNEIDSEKIEHENSLNYELSESRASIDILERSINQEKSKIALLSQKKDHKEGLEELKRKWKENQPGETLAEFLLNQHRKIQELQRKQLENSNELESFSKGIELVQNYLSIALQKIEVCQYPPIINTNQYLKQKFPQILNSIKQILGIAFKKSQQNKQYSKKISVQESNSEKYLKILDQKQSTSNQIVGSYQMIVQQLVQRINNSVKEFQKINEQSKVTIIKKIDEDISTLMAQLARSRLQLEKTNSEKTISEFVNEQFRKEGLKIQEIKTIMGRSQSAIKLLINQNTDLSIKLEQMTTQHHNSINSLQQQLTQNNVLIRQALTHGQTINQGLNFKPLIDKNQELLNKLIELQKEITQWKEENKTLQQKNQELEREILRKSQERYENQIQIYKIAKQQDKEKMQASIESQKAIQEMRQRFHSLEKYFLQHNQPTDKQNQNDEIRIHILVEQLRQSQRNVNDLSSRNIELSSKLIQLRKQYQNQINNLKAQKTESKSKKLHLIKEIDKLKHHYEEIYREQINQLKKYKQECFALRSKISDHEQISKNRLQTQDQLTTERQKVRSLQTKIINLEEELRVSHLEIDRLGIQAGKQIKAMTKVVGNLEEQLGKKTQHFSFLHENLIQKENIMKKMQQHSNTLQNQLQEALNANKSMIKKNQSLQSQLTDLKSDFSSMQAENQSSRNVVEQYNKRLSTLENQIKQRQQTFNSILLKSKSTSDNLNKQLYNAKEDLLREQRKFDEQISLKNSLINKLEHQIIELQNKERDFQQKCLMLQQTVQKQKNDPVSDKKDKEVDLLHQQIASLQQVLGNLSKSYKQLSVKYEEEKNRIGASIQQQKNMDESGKAVRSLQDNSELSQEIRSIVINNEHLQLSLQLLEEEKTKLLEKVETQPEREYVVELLFNILLGARQISPQSPQANLLWNELLQINQRCPDVGEFFSELQNFSLKLLSIQLE